MEPNHPATPADPAPAPGGALRSFPGEELPSHLLDPLVGKQIGAWRLIGVLARGGQRRIYKARHHPTDRLAAVQVLRAAPEPGQEAPARAHFFSEARALAQAAIPALPEILEIGGEEEGGTAFVAMEHVEGRTLQERLAWERRLGAEEVLAIGRAVAEALDRAHRAGFCHGNLKPANVILAPDGRVRVSGFGVEPVLQSRSGVGAPLQGGSFLAPEQIEGAPASPRSDVYALGALLGLCLAGQHPEDAGGGVAEWLMHRAPEVRGAPILAWAVQQAARRRPGDRFAGMAAMLQALELAERQRRGEEVPLTSLQGGHLRTLGDRVDATTMGGRSVPPAPEVLPSGWLYAIIGVGGAMTAAGLLLGWMAGAL